MRDIQESDEREALHPWPEPFGLAQKMQDETEALATSNAYRRAWLEHEAEMVGAFRRNVERTLFYSAEQHAELDRLSIREGKPFRSGLRRWERVLLWFKPEWVYLDGSAWFYKLWRGSIVLLKREDIPPVRS